MSFFIFMRLNYHAVSESKRSADESPGRPEAKKARVGVDIDIDRDIDTDADGRWKM